MTSIIKAMLPSGRVLYAKGQPVDGLPQGEPTVTQLSNTSPVMAFRSHLFSRWWLPTHHARFPPRHLGVTCRRRAKAWRRHRRSMCVSQRRKQWRVARAAHTQLWQYERVLSNLWLVFVWRPLSLLSASSWRHFHSVLSRSHTGTTPDFFFYQHQPRLRNHCDVTVTIQMLCYSVFVTPRVTRTLIPTLVFFYWRKVVHMVQNSWKMIEILMKKCCCSIYVEVNLNSKQKLVISSVLLLFFHVYKVVVLSWSWPLNVSVLS